MYSVPYTHHSFYSAGSYKDWSGSVPVAFREAGSGLLVTGNQLCFSIPNVHQKCFEIGETQSGKTAV